MPHSSMRITTKRLTIMAVLTAMHVVLSRFVGIQVSPYLRITFAFLTNAMAGWLMGPLCAALTGAAGDIIGAVLFPSGAYFPGFTVTAMLAGVTYGLVLYGKPITWKRAALALLPVTLVCNIGLNTLWLWMINGAAALASFPVRALKNICQYPVDVALLYGTGRLMMRLPARIRNV